MKPHSPCSQLLVLCFVALAGCNSPNNSARVEITYEQLANFRTYVVAADGHATGNPGGIFVLYKINRIANTGPEATTFVFDNHRVATVTVDKTSNQETGSDTTLLGAMLVDDLTVQPGETRFNPGCFLKTALTDHPEALAYSTGLINLVYHIDPSQPVTMTRAPGDTSTTVLTDALPSQLQSLCGN